jgi:hypothetical protein
MAGTAELRLRDSHETHDRPPAPAEPVGPEGTAARGADIGSLARRHLHFVSDGHHRGVDSAGSDPG